MAKKETVVAVKQDDQEPVTVEVLAAAIVRLDATAQRLYQSGLNENAIVTLIDGMNVSTGIRYNKQRVGKAAIRAVLRNLKALRKTYCTI